MINLIMILWIILCGIIGGLIGFVVGLIPLAFSLSFYSKNKDVVILIFGITFFLIISIGTAGLSMLFNFLPCIPFFYLVISLLISLGFIHILVQEKSKKKSKKASIEKTDNKNKKGGRHNN